MTGLVLCGYSDYFWDSVHAYECIQELKELTEGGGGAINIIQPPVEIIIEVDLMFY